MKYAAFKSANGGAEETRRIATEMTKQAPDYLPGWTLLAELAFKDKKYDEALSLLENVFSRDPENIDGRRLQSDVLLAKGDTKKAVEVLEQLDQTYPDVPSSNINWHAHISKITIRTKQRWRWTRPSQLNPNYDDAVLLLAEINISTGHGRNGDRTDDPFAEKKARSQDRRIAPGRRLWLA